MAEKNIYSKKQIWKALLLLGALTIALASVSYTNSIVEKLAQEEEKKVQLWAEATTKLGAIEDLNSDLELLFKIIQNNKTVPVILVDENEQILSWRNLDSAKALNNPQYLEKKLASMRASNPSIVIPIGDGVEQNIYYENSMLIDMLKYYPFMQLSVIGIFIIVSYVAFSSSRKAEQNQVWVGLAKETAHQLGTPLSSLMGWVEYLKTQDGLDSSVQNELGKDVQRLEMITDRFSKIGSQPTFEPTDLLVLSEKVVGYLRSRISKKVEIQVTGVSVIHPISPALFEWVIENITKNAVDAMEGKGTITIHIHAQNAKAVVDISDTGKGIAKADFKKVFKPGFTTKTRGWGLGLSLVKRIVEEYHRGKIFVDKSELGVGTTFRIVL